MFDKLLQWFSENNLFATKDEIDILRKITSGATIQKNTIIMKQGRSVQKLFFLNNGLARLYRTHDHIDTTIAFIKDGEFASTIIYLLNQVPSPCAIGACTDLEVLCWDRSDIIHLINHTSLGRQLEATLTEVLLSWIQDREVDKLSLDPESRYLKLIETHPVAVQQVSLKHIASYLGIHQDSLSRIRKRINRKF